MYDDPEDPDYEEELIDEPEGKSYRPLLDHVEPSFSKIKSDQQLNRTFLQNAWCDIVKNKISIFLLIS